jgi:hypothetical protein
MELSILYCIKPFSFYAHGARRPQGQITNSMEQSPWKKSTRSASQEIFRLVRIPNFHYHIHKSPSTETIQSQFYWVHNLKLYLC